MKFDQDLCLNLQYDFGKMNSTLGSVVPLAMFSNVGGLEAGCQARKGSVEESES